MKGAGLCHWYIPVGKSDLKEGRIMNRLPAHNPGGSSEEKDRRLHQELAISMSESLRSIADELLERPGQYSLDFQPSYRIGDTVHIIKSDGERDIIIDMVDSLPGFRHDAGALTATTTGNDITTLDMPTGEMAQFRFSPMAAFMVEFNHPGGVRRWKTSTQNHRLGPWLDDPGMPDTVKRSQFAASEFWVFEDETPRFDYYLYSGHTVQGHIDFFGWRYHFRELTGDQRGARLLRVNGWPG